MEKSKPMELGLGELLSNPNIVNNNSFRFISRDLGVIISFAQMDSILFSTGRPYRAKESRIPLRYPCGPTVLLIRMA